MAEQGKDTQPPENADAPYDSYEIVDTDDGCKAVFYIASIRERTDREWPAFALSILEDNRRHFQGLGRVTPVTDQAIEELRRHHQGEHAQP